MERLTSILKNKATLTILLFIIVISAALAFGKIRSKDSDTIPIDNQTAETVLQRTEPSVENNLSKAILSVNDMSCSGCIATIKSSLAPLKGIGDILVDVQGGSAEIFYDDTVLKDVSEMSEAITAAGYPASVQSIVSPEDLENERALADSKAQYYIASVGGWDIARSDFDTEMEIERGKYAKIYGEDLFASAQGEQLKTQLQSQIVTRLLDEGVIMQEIVKAGFKVSPDAIEKEITEMIGKMGKSVADFRASLDQQGRDFNYFKKKLERNVLIGKYIEDSIVTNASNPVEKQNMFTAWYNNSKALAKIVYYDKDLEKLIRNQNASSGCGSSCSLAKKSSS